MRKYLGFGLFLLTVLLLTAVVSPPAEGAAPIDHRSLAPNHPSELPGAGFLLTDPYQGASRAYWAGAYRSVAGQRSYCIDDYYDYPDPRYGYRTSEAAGWAARPGSNSGANGRTAQRIAWIVNRYGNSTSPAVDAEVSMAINLLMGSVPFNRSYYGYFRPQLAAIDAGIVPAIDRMLTDSARWAGPYRAEVRMGPAPVLGGQGRFTVLIRSAAGFSVPWSNFVLQPGPGIRLLGPMRGTTGHTGVVTYHFQARRAGVLAVGAIGEGLANNTIRIGYSPTHATNNFSTGSQRVALISSHPLITTPPRLGRVRVGTPTLQTAVDATGKPVHQGERVRDHVTGTGLAPGALYRLSVSLRGRTGLSCGTHVESVHPDGHGRLDFHTAGLPACGGGSDTFSEQLFLNGFPVAVSRPGQPAETFPVTPSISTAVHGGNGPRPTGTQVADEVQVNGLVPVQPVQLEVRLTDRSGRSCGARTVPVRADAAGRLNLTTPALPACGRGQDTFIEQVRAADGSMLVSSAAWASGEYFPLQPPPARPSPPASSSHPVPPPSKPVAPARPRAAPPGPKLALTGAASQLALAGGLVALGLGGLLKLYGRRA